MFKFIKKVFRIFFIEIFNLKKLGKVHIIQLERLHTRNSEVMKNFCLKFHKN